MSGATERLTTGDLVLDASRCRCRREDNGRLDIAFPGGELEDVQLIPTFPLSRRLRMIAVRNADGDEVALIDDASKLEAASREVMQEELERSYFMPRITNILGAEEKLSILTLEVETDRGPRTIDIRNARRSFRRLARSRVVIRDVDGNRYEVRNWTRLPAYGRDLIGQYL